MACIEKIYSVSALIGGASCNGNCAFCAGKYLREDAKFNPLWDRNFEAAIKLSARYGGWSLSLTSSGEPLLYPQDITEALLIYQKCAKQGAYFPNVNIFTNGILLGDREFCDRYLPEWRSLGLTNIAVSVHSTWKGGQDLAYGLKQGTYPAFRTIRKNVERHGVGVRATLLLRRGGVQNERTYADALEVLTQCHGFNNITSWPVGNPDGSRNEFTPSRWGLFTIRRWLHKNATLCHGHSWGGGVYDWKGNIVRLTDYVTKHDKDKDFVRQLVVFQDGTVHYSWIKEGSLCMK